MKKSIIVKIVVGILIFVCVVYGALVFFISNLFKSGNVPVMDFNEELHLKRPAEVKASPTILFLGNSMTYINDLPEVFGLLSQSGGFEPEVYDLTEGSYRLQYFADETDEVGAQVYAALESYTWDYVVLQEQSGIATMGGEDLMYPAARTLDEMIRSAEGESVFLMTWAYKDGFAHKFLGVNVEKTTEEMQTMIAGNYRNIAGELDALLAPAGIAFMRCAKLYPEIELWDEDKTHPSPAGTYLAACVLYRVLYDQSPEGLSYTADLNGETALKLQLVAAGIN